MVVLSRSLCRCFGLHPCDTRSSLHERVQQRMRDIELKVLVRSHRDGDARVRAGGDLGEDLVQGIGGDVRK